MDDDERLERAIDATPDIESQAARFAAPDPDARQEGNTPVCENFQATVRRLDRDDERLHRGVHRDVRAL
jgi:translation initiation factor 2 subunit 2